MKKISMLLLTMILSAQTITALAWGKIVFDPTNFSKNIVTASSSLKIEAEEVKQRIQQYKQLQTMYDNLKKIDPSKYDPQVTNIADALKTYNLYKASLNEVNKALGDEGDYLDNLRKNYVLSGEGKFEDYLNVLQKRSDSGNAKAKQLLNMSESVSKNVENTAKRRSELQKQISNSEGVLQSSQTTNQYLDVIVSQNAEMATLMSENLRAMAEERKLKAIQDENKKKYEEEYSKKSKEGVDTFYDRWNKK
jgi:P-type conjugative transfer protein TrbJ